MRVTRATLPLVTLALLVVATMSGCYYFYGTHRKTDRSSSVVSFLYPGEQNPLPPTSIPVLRLPLRVGIAFVPSGTERNPYVAQSGITEIQKTVLMQRVAEEFKAYPFIQSIEIIPSTYLRPGGGFANLEQLRNMLRVDVIALVAYDQVQFTSNNLLSLTYWTIVGAYIFQGNQNDTHTLMEAAVYDIESRHLLFRAPGASLVRAQAAGEYLGDHLRYDSARGFDAATGELITNLKLQLDQFRERVKQSPGEVQIEHRPGYSGGGATGGVLAGLLAMLAAVRWIRRRA